MAKNEETLNEYRAERKARIAKAAKKSNKGGTDSTKIAQIVIYAICAVAVIAVFISGLFYFGVPQKYMTAVKLDGRNYSYAEYSYYYANYYQNLVSSAEANKESFGTSIAIVDGNVFTPGQDPAAMPFKKAAKTTETAATATDATASDATAQDATATEATKADATTTTDSKYTFADYINDQVVEEMEQMVYYLGLAKDAGITELSDEHQKELDDTLANIRQYAEQYNYSASRYISLLYGKGLTEKALIKLMTEQYLVSQYLEGVQDEIGKEIDDEAINTVFEENKLDYTMANLRIFALPLEKEDEDSTATDATAKTSAADKAETPEEIKALIEEMASKIDPENAETSFAALAREYCLSDDADAYKTEEATLAKGITYNIAKQNDEGFADWLFKTEGRKSGDITTFTNEQYSYVAMVVDAPFVDDTMHVDVRHILVSFDNVKKELEEAASGTDATKTDATATKGTASDGKEITTEGTDYTLDVVTKAYEEALEIYNKYGEAENEANFGDLADEYTADTGAAAGGLYKDISIYSSYVPEFLNWATDESRQPGDTDIVKTQYGWHIMYFSKTHEEPSYMETIRASLAEEKANEKFEEFKAEYVGTATLTGNAAKAFKDANALINDLYVSRS